MLEEGGEARIRARHAPLRDQPESDAPRNFLKPREGSSIETSRQIGDVRRGWHIVIPHITPCSGIEQPRDKDEPISVVVARASVDNAVQRTLVIYIVHHGTIRQDVREAIEKGEERRRNHSGLELSDVRVPLLVRLQDAKQPCALDRTLLGRQVLS